MKHLFRSVLLVTLLALSGLLLSSCGTQGPSQSQVESINTEIKSQQPNNLPPAPPPTDVMPAAPGDKPASLSASERKTEGQRLFCQHSEPLTLGWKETSSLLFLPAGPANGTASSVGGEGTTIQKNPPQGTARRARPVKEP
jgi:hypothetical protein